MKDALLLTGQMMMLLFQQIIWVVLVQRINIHNQFGLDLQAVITLLDQEE